MRPRWRQSFIQGRSLQSSHPRQKFAVVSSKAEVCSVVPGRDRAPRRDDFHVVGRRARLIVRTANQLEAQLGASCSLNEANGAGGVQKEWSPSEAIERTGTRSAGMAAK